MVVWASKMKQNYLWIIILKAYNEKKNLIKVVNSLIIENAQFTQ